MLQKNIRRIRRFMSIFFPRNMYKILNHLYYMTTETTRTQELIKVIKEEGYSTFLEVGVWKGDNIISIAKTNPNIQCYGIDPYDYRQYDNQLSIRDDKFVLLKKESERVFKETSHFQQKYKNFKLIRKTSDKGAEDFEDESLDIVFIDANHSYESVKKDIDLWLPKLRNGGCLSGHDYSIAFFGVIQAVNDKLGVDNIAIRSDATWFYYKKLNL